MFISFNVFIILVINCACAGYCIWYIAMNVRKRMKDNFKSIVDMSYFARNSLKLNACSEHSIAVISSSSTVKVVQIFL